MKKIITIFGATGNLMYKKLFPALSNLFKNKFLDSKTKIYLVGRKDYTLEDYLLEAKKEIKTNIEWDLLLPHLNYIQMDFSSLDDYKRLKTIINEDESLKDKMFYLAVPPQLFPVIAKGINSSGLITKGSENERIVFEKPFGEDLTTAQEINKELWQYFEEKQIYRIDHYLGKEMIQNILIVRFTNTIFEQAWNNKTISSIQIVAKETEGVLRRGNYYDKVGALKDMVQSHLLQMVSLVTMEKPKTFASDDIKDEKVKVIKQLSIDKEDIILGQYQGYQDSINIESGSTTETFVFAKACINNERWKGVPIYLLTGKSLDEKKSEIIINFKNDSTNFKNVLNNKLIIRVAPVEGVNFIFNVKEAGLGEKVVPANLDYCHTCNYLGNTPEAYEKLLLDLFNKQNSLFTRWDEIENSWKIIDEVKTYKHELFIYKNYEEIKELIIKRNEGLIHDL